MEWLINLLAIVFLVTALGVGIFSFRDYSGKKEEEKDAFDRYMEKLEKRWFD